VKASQLAFLKRALPKATSGEVRRAAARFGVVAAAGELATRLGVTGWLEGQADGAVQKCFDGWLKARGTAGALEEEMGLKQVRAFIQAHGTSRFQQRIRASNGKNIISDRQPVRDRVGFRAEESGEMIYFVFADLFPKICEGFDPTVVGRALKRRGHLAIRNPDPERVTVQRRFPGLKRVYVYPIRSSVLSQKDNCDNETGSSISLKELNDTHPWPDIVRVCSRRKTL
jgi:putative DNA primase/helicase